MRANSLAFCAAGSPGPQCGRDPAAAKAAGGCETAGMVSATGTLTLRRARTPESGFSLSAQGGAAARAVTMAALYAYYPVAVNAERKC